MMSFNVTRRKGKASPPPGDGVGLMAFTDSKLAYMLGPQTLPGVYVQPGTANMEASLTARIATWVANCTSLNGFVAQAGTVNVTQNSSTITGSGTTFTGKVGRPIRIPDVTMACGYRYFVIVSVTSATECVIGAYQSGGTDDPKTWLGATNTGLAWDASNPATDGAGNTADDFNPFYNYYDTGYSLYQAWAKNDNMAPGSTILSNVRTMLDNMAATASIGEFTYRSDQGFKTTPRTAAFLGFCCRALDGKPEWFDNLDAFADVQSQLWLYRYRLGQSLATSKPTVRDGAYCLMFCAVLGVIHPNTTRRDYFRDRAIALALDPVDRRRDTSYGGGGQWFQMTDSGDGAYVTDSGGVNEVEAVQPFINSLMVSALRWVHRMMRWHGMTADPNYATIQTAFLSGCDGIISAYRGSHNGFNANVRSLPYWACADNQLINGSITPAVPTTPGAPFAVYPQNTNWDGITTDRQLNADSFGNLAYAFAITGNTTYRDKCLDMLGSCFEFQGVNGDMSKLSSYWYTGHSQKNSNQHHGVGDCQKVGGWILGGLETF